MANCVSGSKKQKWTLCLALIVVWAMISSAIGTVAHADQEPSIVPSQPSLVAVSATELLVQKRMPDGDLAAPESYTIRGVSWSPTSPCVVQSQLPMEFAKWYETDIPLMAEMGVNTVRTFMDFGTGPIAIQVLDELYRHDVMVIMTVDRGVADASNIMVPKN